MLPDYTAWKTRCWSRSNLRSPLATRQLGHGTPHARQQVRRRGVGLRVVAPVHIGDGIVHMYQQVRHLRACSGVVVGLAEIEGAV